MPTEIKLWNLKNGHLKPLAQGSFSHKYKEKDLEDWVEKEPSLLGRELAIIGRQLDIPGAGSLDLLAIDDDGRLVIIEFKRQITTREAIAQILDYASSIRKMNLDQFSMLLKGSTENLPEIKDFDPAMILVAAEADSKAERIVDYLSSKAQLAIEVVTFTYVPLENGEEILARSILVPDTPLAGSSKAKQLKLPEIIKIAIGRDVTKLVNTFRNVESLGWGEEPLSNFGGTLRYWITAPDGTYKVLFGMNVGGMKLDSPIGSLDLWFNPETIAEYSGSPLEAVWSDLEHFSVAKKTPTQIFIRVTNFTPAEKLYELLQKWEGFSADRRAIVDGIAKPSQRE